MTSKLNFITVPMGGKGSEYMERRGKTAFLSHAIDTSTGKPLCPVRVDFLCLDSSLATTEMPECPKCAAKVRRSLRK